MSESDNSKNPVEDTTMNIEDESESHGLGDRIVMMWRDDEIGEWKEGMEHSLTIEDVMTKLEDPPKVSAEWKLRRNAVQSVLTSMVQKWFFKRGLYFGGIHVKRGDPVRYVLAETAEEFFTIYSRYWRRFERTADNMVEHRKLVKDKMMSLPESFVQKRKLLGSATRKSLKF